jgi:hypothetical protein
LVEVSELSEKGCVDAITLLEVSEEGKQSLI